jgi:hypothetical protein
MIEEPVKFSKVCDNIHNRMAPCTTEVSHINGFPYTLQKVSFLITAGNVLVQRCFDALA